MARQTVPKEMAAQGCHFSWDDKRRNRRWCKPWFEGMLFCRLQDPPREGKGWGQHPGRARCLGHRAELSPQFGPCGCSTGEKELGSGGEKAVSDEGTTTSCLVGAPIMETGVCQEPCVSVSDFGALPDSWCTVG